MPRLVVTGIEKGTRLSAIEENVRDKERLLKQIGAIQVAGAQEAFRVRGRPSDSWDDRITPNWPAIIANRGRPLARHFQPRRGLLHGTGDLAGSINFHARQDEVEIGSALPYAGIQQYGGETETDVLTEEVQHNLEDWLSRESNYQWIDSLQWLTDPNLRGQRLPLRVRARPFVTVEDQDVDDWADMLGREIVETD